MRLIDADEVRKHAVEKYQGNGVELEPIMMVPLSVIDNAPTVAYPFEKFRTMLCGTCQAYMRVEPDRQQGEWIMQRHDLDGCFYTCSNCGRMIRVSLFIDDPEDNETLADYPFCHCGADMRKGGAK